MAPHRPHDTQPPRDPVRSRARESVTHASSRVAAGRGDNRGSPPSGGRYGILLLVLIATYLLSAFTTGRLITGFQAALFLALLLIALRTAPLTRRTARLTGAVALAGSACRRRRDTHRYRGRRGRGGYLERAAAARYRGRDRPAGARPAGGDAAEYLRRAQRVHDHRPDVRRVLRRDRQARQQPVLRERAACERQDLSVLQLRHTDYAWLRRLHRRGQQRQGHSGPRGADRPGVPRDPRRPAGCRLPVG